MMSEVGYLRFLTMQYFQGNKGSNWFQMKLSVDGVDVSIYLNRRKYKIMLLSKMIYRPVH